MMPDRFYADLLRPGLVALAGLGGPMRTPEAECFLLAVALQESGLTQRVQVLANGHPGPARGFWQFEQGGVRGILSHPASISLALTLCKQAQIEPNTRAVWRALEGHDALAIGFARLLLLTDPYPIPTTESTAWDAYAHRLWRPGKPHPDSWGSNWVIAAKTVKA